TVRRDELGDFMALPTAQAACAAIARKVEERGPDDNYTAVVVRVLPDDGSATQESPTLPAPGAYVPARDAATAPPGTFNPPHHVSPTRSSPLGGPASALAVLALLLAAFATWTALQARST